MINAVGFYSRVGEWTFQLKLLLKTKNNKRNKILTFPSSQSGQAKI